jgi:RNA recognition motif-containing protein
MNIYVSNLDLQVNNDELRNLFTPFGSVTTAQIAMDGFTEQSRGFGYVEMPKEEEALAAIAALNNKQVNGKEISVQQVDEMGKQKGSYKVGNGPMQQYRFKRK